MPGAHFYLNNAGELFAAVSEKSSSSRFVDSYFFRVFSFSPDGRNVLKYSGRIRIDDPKTSKTAYVELFRIADLQKINERPPSGEQGGKVFRMVVEEALRLGAKKLRLNPMNSELEAYYRRTFGFRRVKLLYYRPAKKGDLIEMNLALNSAKPLKPRRRNLQEMLLETGDAVRKNPAKIARSRAR